MKKRRTEIAVQRAMRKMTQKDLAERTGLSRQTINAIESGKGNTSLFNALKLASAFDVEVEELFNED